MDKKELKLYVTPEQEIINLELEGQLLDASLPSYEEEDPMD
jgi:hypothetical protein